MTGKICLTAALLILTAFLFGSCIPANLQQRKFGLVHFMREARHYGWECRNTGKKSFHCWRREG